MPFLNENSLVKIAVADDHHLFRESLCALIDTWENCKVVIQAANGRQLLEKLHPKNLPDLVLVDLEMPEMNGYETLKAIKEKYPEIRLLVISLHYSEELVWRIIKFGAQGFVNKNDDIARLKKAIAEMIRNGYFFSDHTASKMVKKAMQTGTLTIQNDLSETDVRFLKLVSSEKTYKEIAREMKLTGRQIEYLRNNLFDRFEVCTRTGLAVIAMEKGLAV